MKEHEYEKHRSEWMDRLNACKFSCTYTLCHPFFSFFLAPYKKCVRFFFRREKKRVLHAVIVYIILCMRERVCAYVCLCIVCIFAIYTSHPFCSLCTYNARHTHNTYVLVCCLFIVACLMRVKGHNTNTAISRWDFPRILHIMLCAAFHKYNINKYFWLRCGFAKQQREQMIFFFLILFLLFIFIPLDLFYF